MPMSTTYETERRPSIGIWPSTRRPRKRSGRADPPRTRISGKRCSIGDGSRGRRAEMAVKVVVELKTKPGKRDELKRLFETLMAEIGPSLKEKGSLGSALYAVLDDPDLLVEIADWESAEAHEAVMRDPATAEALAPGLELLASPFKVMILQGT